jgi:peroxiredoxin
MVLRRSGCAQHQVAIFTQKLPKRKWVFAQGAKCYDQVVKSLLLSIVVCLPLVTPAHADDGNEILHKVAAGYDAIPTYELEGVETVVLPGMDCTLDAPISIAVAPAPLSGGISFRHGTKPSKACFDALTKLGSLPMRGEWSNFRSMDVGVKSVRELAPQVLTPPGAEIRCLVLEVVYDNYYQKLRHYDGPVRFWIDSETRLVRRVEFSEESEQGPRGWTATIEKVRIGGPPAAWVSVTPKTAPQEETTWIGKLAPDFELRTSDGEWIRLKDLRGKVVVLDFWATWCGSCLEEIPVLEKLQAEASPSKVIFLGISDEEGPAVRKWREENHRSFQSLVDGKKTVDDFGIQPIPALVVIDPNGTIVKYMVGFDSERRLRESLGSLIQGK